MVELSHAKLVQSKSHVPDTHQMSDFPQPATKRHLLTASPYKEAALTNPIDPHKRIWLLLPNPIPFILKKPLTSIFMVFFSCNIMIG